MHQNEELINTFYTCFKQLNADGMVKCYHPEIQFSDPVFPNLQGEQAKDMWRMLCDQATGFELSFSNIKADDNGGTAHWEPIYAFSKTGRKVHNIIDATFKFKDGLIIEHQDSFDLWRWSRMALGPVGALLGWTPFMKNKIRAMAQQGLTAFSAQK